MEETNKFIENLENIINKKQECPEDYATISEIIKQYNKKEREFKREKAGLINTMEEYYESCNSCPGLFYNHMKVSVETFNYNENKMILNINEIGHNKYTVHLTRKEEDLRLINVDSYKALDFFRIYGPLLSSLYDLYINNESFIQDRVGTIFRGENIKGTSLYFDLDKFGFSIHTFRHKKCIEKRCFDDDLQLYGIDSLKGIQFIDENANTIFDHLYFEINKLPRYMQEEIRQEKKEKEQQRIIEEQMLQEALKDQEEKTRRKEGRKVKSKSFIIRFKIGD